MAKKNQRNSRRREEEKKEFEEVVIQIDRVTRVVKGGRRLRFRCTVAIGDQKGRVGIGVGKAGEVVNGIKKAVSRAKANIIKIPLTKDNSIPHEIQLKYKAAKMLILPASQGTGVIAGGALRTILKLAGVENALSKNYGTKNKVVTAQASIKALQMLRPLKDSMKKDQKAEVKTEHKKEDKKGASADVSRHEGRREKTEKKVSEDKAKNEAVAKEDKKMVEEKMDIQKNESTSPEKPVKKEEVEVKEEKTPDNESDKK